MNMTEGTRRQAYDDHQTNGSNSFERRKPYVNSVVYNMQGIFHVNNPITPQQSP